MRIRVDVATAATLAFGLFAAGPGHGQVGREASSRSFTALRQSIAQVDGVGAREIRLHWFARSPRVASQPAIEDVQVLANRSVPGRVKRERHPELSLDKLLVVAADASGRELDWRIVADPRLVRGEVADPSGALTGQTLLRSEADLLLTVPDLPDIRSLRLYEPRWTGREFVLDLLAAVDLP